MASVIAHRVEYITNNCAIFVNAAAEHSKWEGRTITSLQRFLSKTLAPSENPSLQRQLRPKGLRRRRRIMIYSTAVGTTSLGAAKTMTTSSSYGHHQLQINYVSFWINSSLQRVFSSLLSSGNRWKVLPPSFVAVLEYIRAIQHDLIFNCSVW